MRCTSLAALAVGIFASSAWAAGPYSAVALTPSSFNQDGIVDFGSPTALGAVTATMDNGTNLTAGKLTGNTWYEIGYNPSALTTGLPSGFIFGETDPKSTFFIEDADEPNNVLLLDTTHKTGTFTFVTPRFAGGLAFTTSSGNAGSPAPSITAVVHFSNGAADITLPAFSSPDWFGATDSLVYTAKGRVDVGTGAFDTQSSIATNPRIYEETVAIPAADAANPIKSIDLSWTGVTAAHTMVFGVSTAVPEPATAALLGLGGLALLLRRRA
jgi:hypothetical protein